MRDNALYRFVPQKRRSKFRLFCGMIFFTFMRRAYWMLNRSRFVKRTTIPLEKLKHDFPYVAASHSSPIFRNLSKEDTALQNGKAVNLALAAERVNGTVLKSGEIFSFWRLVGNPTRRKGYQKGMMLVNGKPVAAIGGGLCALSNLIYWMTLHTPLTVTERFRHSYDVFPDSSRTVPFGSGATCVYNYRDLMIQNNTAFHFALCVRIENGMLVGEWRSDSSIDNSYEVYQKSHYISHEGAGIYVRHNTLYRKTFLLRDGERILLCDEKVTENHALMMYEPLLEAATGTESRE